MLVPCIRCKYSSICRFILSEALLRLLAALFPQIQGKVFTQCRPALQRAAATSRMVTVRAVASQAHNPNAITKKVFMDMEIGGNKAGGHCSPCAQPSPRPVAHSSLGRERGKCPRVGGTRSD
jgi:hypothetical protein